MIISAGEGAALTTYTIITRNGRETVEAGVISERLVTVSVNGQDLLTVMCTPTQQEALALGFLANEGIIRSLDDVEFTHLCGAGTRVDVWLAFDFEPPRNPILTSGCGSGVTFDDLSTTLPPLKSRRRVTPERLWALMDELQHSADLYKQAGGVHTSALSNGERLLIVVEDVGRHNTLDKLRGLALQQGINTRGCVLLTTGRISSEMINKARHMQAPVVCSHTSPTSLSVRLAADWNIMLVGYLRRNSMNVYTHPERIRPEQPAHSSNGRSKGKTVHV